MRKEFEESTQQAWEEGQAIVMDDNFDILQISKGTAEATELIESKGFKEAFAQLQGMYDIIIVDTPPAGLFPDAGLIGNYAHHFIFLTLLNKHRKKALKAILNRLDQSNAEILGLIANKVTHGKSRNLGTYRYGDYRKYKNYYPITEKIS
jgi:Mrp family chromosome partitioning ATPase